VIATFLERRDVDHTTIVGKTVNDWKRSFSMRNAIISKNSVPSETRELQSKHLAFGSGPKRDFCAFWCWFHSNEFLFQLKPVGAEVIRFHGSLFI
jgi:hypothetical protein